MVWKRGAGLAATLLIVVAAVGAVVSLATNGLFTGSQGTAAAIVLVIVAVGVLGMVLLGRRSSRHTYNPDAYW